MVLTNYAGDFWKFAFLNVTDLFLNFKFTFVPIWKNQKPPLSGKRAIVERNGAKFATHGELFNQTINQSINQSIKQSSNQAINQSSNHSINKLNLYCAIPQLCSWRSYCNSIGVPLALYRARSFGVIRCTYDFSKIKVPNHSFFYKSQPTFITLVPSYILNGSHKTPLGIFEIVKFDILITFSPFL